MASRKEEKERLRQERLEAERRSSAEARKRLMLGYIVAGILAAAVIGGMIFVLINAGGGSEGEQSSSENVNTNYGVLPEGLPIDEREGTPPPEVANGDLEGAAAEAGCDLELNLPNEGSNHFDDESKVVDYETSPPTSGDHYASNDPRAVASGALADGAFLETPPLPRAVHSLEHGRIQIQYSPDLPEEDQLALKGVFDADRAAVSLFPNPDMPYEVAAAAWTQLLGCKTFDGATTLDAIRDFREQYRGRGPEPVGF